MIAVMRNLENIKFGRLTVIDRGENHVSPSGRKYATWNCLCECGNTKKVLEKNLLAGLTKSCGCLHKELAKKANTKHGLWYNRIYKIWKSMHYRCKDGNKEEYKHYAGRGIAVCAEWDDFDAFYKWAISNGYDDKLTIDRIDVNKGYSPENCRWVTQKIQTNNKRNNVRLEYQGKVKTMAQWSEELGISYKVLKDRVTRKGMLVEEVVNELKQRENNISSEE